MPQREYNLAIETSGRGGSATLGRGDQCLADVELTATRRHSVGLMPGIDALCRAHSITPRDIGELYVSLGPGSFTGLRVGLAAAKMFALARNVCLVGVPTLDVLAANAPDSAQYTAVCLNLKRETAYCAVFERGEGDQAPKAVVAPALRTIEALLDAAPRPLAIIAEKLPISPENLPAQVDILPARYAAARSRVVWRLGRTKADRGDYTPPAQLLPLYVREPEAVTQWNARLESKKTRKQESKKTAKQ